MTAQEIVASAPGFIDISARFCFSLYIALAVFLVFGLPAVALNEAISIHIGPIYLDGNSVGNSELRDRILYLPFYLLAPIAIFFANWRVSAEHIPPPVNAFALVAVIILIHLGLSSANKELGILLLCLALAIVVAALLWRRGQYEPAPAAASPAVWRLGWLDAVALAALCILLLPASSDRVAAHIGTNIAKISYIVGPALYSYGRHLAPGLDFYSHYGAGLGPVFSHLMGSGWKSAATNGIELTLAITVLFYAMEYLLLLALTGSRLLAFAAPVFTALLNFSTYFAFDAPSAYPVRYPFLLPFVLAFGWLCGAQRRFAPIVAMSIFAGLSLFWHTEIGLYLILAGIGGIFLAFGIRLRDFATAGFFVLGTLAAFFALAWLFVGTPALSWSFLVAAVMPITAYAGGWDGVPVKWDTVWSLFYNIPLQLAAIATIGGFWFLMWRRRDALSVRERRVGGVLAMLSLVGLGMLTKWINRSLDAEWNQSAAPLGIVICWWGHFLWVSRAHEAFKGAAAIKRIGAATAPILAAVAFLLFVRDNDPYPYGLRAYVGYPSIAKAIVAPSHLYDQYSYSDEALGHNLNFGWDWPELLTGISSDDIALIQRYSGPHERVAVVSTVDWAYLAQAQRPPKAFFVPVEWAFTPEFIDRSLQGADILFIDNRTFSRVDTPAGAQLVERINKDYVAGERSTTLTLYRSIKSTEPSRPESRS